MGLCYGAENPHFCTYLLVVLTCVNICEYTFELRHFETKNHSSAFRGEISSRTTLAERPEKCFIWPDSTLGDADQNCPFGYGSVIDNISKEKSFKTSSSTG